MSKSLIAADTSVLNTQLFYNQLDRLMGASIGVIAVRTREMSRGRMLMHQWASMRGMDFNVWDVNAGFLTYRALPVVDGDSEPEVAIETEDMAAYLNSSGKVSGTDNIIDAMDHYRKRQASKDCDKNMFCGVFMGVVGDWLKNESVQQHIRDHVQRAYQINDRMILMLTPGTEIPDAVIGDIEVIDLNPPSFTELMEAFSEMKGDIPEEFNYEPDDDDAATIVQNGIGMTQQEFENAVSLGIVDISARRERHTDDDGEFSVTVKDFVNVVRGRKLEILKQTNMMELMPEAPVNSVGGLDLLKADLELRKSSFTPEARAYGIQPPKGFLVVGPPGTGKSLLCSAASAALGLPLVRFDLSSVYNSLVGSSEARMRACLKMAEDMAPCILFIDEIDKAIGSGQSSGDSGVSKRIFGTLLTWMQEKQSKGIPVLVIASANNVSDMPPELMRKGRFDDIWAVSFPSSVERADIFRIHTKKRGHILTDEEYVKLGKVSENFVGAEIEAIVEAALLIDFQAKRPKLTLATLLRKIDETVPQAKVFPKRIEEMRKWCEQNAKPASSQATFAVEPEGIRAAPIRRKGALRIPKRSTAD